MGRNEVRRPEWAAEWGHLGVGIAVLLLTAGCEMAGSRAGDGMLSEIPGTAASEAPAVDSVAVEEPEPVVAPGVEISEVTALAIRDAAAAYVREATAVPNIRVEIDAVADGWARGRALPVGQEADPATIYLREEGGQWQGVSIGTAFTPEDLDEMGVPSAVRR